MLLTAKEGQGDVLARSLAAEYPTLDVNTQEDIRRVLLWELELPRRFLSTISWAAFVIAGLIVANITNIAVRERAQDDFGARTGLPVEIRVDGEERRLSPDVELSFFRVAQEALANARKHARHRRSRWACRLTKRPSS